MLSNKTQGNITVCGIHAACSRCQSDYDLSEQELYDGSADGSVFDEGSFSWSTCELCKDQLGGTRYSAHELINDEWEHLEICGDCLIALA